MTTFQCENCGAIENTALSCQGFHSGFFKYFDWTDIEHLKGKLLSSVCGPTKYVSGEPTEFGVWHNKFKRIIFPVGMFEVRNFELVHKVNGDPYANYIGENQ